MFQGAKEWRERNWQPTPVPASSIDAVILTHAHLDHCGWIPRLVREGFRGPIYATPSTIDLCGIILPDSGHLQEEDASFTTSTRSRSTIRRCRSTRSRKRRTRLQHFQPVEFEETRQLSPEVSFRFVPAAHILGSCDGGTHAQAEWSDAGSCCSAETLAGCATRTARPGKVVRSGPTEGETADVLVMESTYGNRQHPTDDPRPKLAEIIRHTVQRGGSVIVPAFAVERTQKFLFMLKELMESGQIPRIPVYCDSPMAIKAVEVFLKHADECSDETCRLIKQYGSPLQWPGFTFALTADDSKKINNATLSRDHRFLQRHGDRRTHPASPDAAAARSEEYRDLHRLPGAGNAGSHDQERRSRSADFQRDGARSAQKSRCSSNSAIMPTRRSCWNGCALLLKSPRLPTWCTASPRHHRSFATR